MLIYVKIYCEDTLEVRIQPSETIFHLQEIIALASQIPIRQQRLKFGNRELKANHTIESYGIADSAIIHLVGRSSAR